ncbi:amino acid adenylation domain-containing protein [Pseudomonas shahriarae]|nr:non-ribosomal peptide synthetase [Pseudomonas shahriarae]QXH91355.1 amino acid adenylation domain-containing protein [Pseudomonas shahriarae]
MDKTVAARIARRFITLPLEKRKLYLEKMLAEGVSPTNLPIPEVQSAFESIPLSFAQERQWVLWQLDPDSAAYNIPTALRLKGKLDVVALEQSFNALIARHQTLRTTFAHGEDRPLQIIHLDMPMQIQQSSVSGLDDAGIKAFIQAQAYQPFDLQQGPLLRVALLQLGQDDHVLVLTQHHIVSDDWSMQVMVDELVALYSDYQQGQPNVLPELTIQYADYAIWQRHWMEAGESERQLAYWQAQLGGEQPVLELPTDHPRPAVQSYRGANIAVTVPASLEHNLKQLAQQHNVTLFMLLLASFQALLHHYSRQSDIRVGVPVANRNRVETERLLGFFVNTQVLRARFDESLSFSELLAQVKQTALDAQAHQDLPFEQLVEALQPERNLSISPLFQVMYNHLKEHQDSTTVQLAPASSLDVEGIRWGSRTAQFDLTFSTFESTQGLSATLNYATDLFEASTIERLGQHWLNLLDRCIAAPQQAIASLSLLSNAQQQQILYDWNDTTITYPLERCTHQWIEQQVESTPDAVALIFGESQLTYNQLNQKANSLAHRLIERGVGHDVLVGIAIERSLDMVIGLLAILKAGGAYVPLDPEYPSDRLAYMMQDSGITLLLSQQTLLDKLPVPAGVETLCLDEPVISAWPSSNPGITLDPENLAYVIYTSGSTGKPKGAANRHCALVNRLCWMQQAYNLTTADTVLQKTPFSFDVSVWEFFWPLMTGARLAIAGPGDHRDPARLVELINQHDITTLHFVPSMLQVFLADEQVSRCNGLKRIVCSGEALSADAQQQVFAKLPNAALYNLYGPTEAAIDVTHWTCREESRSSVPIGQPIANLTTWVLNSDLAPVPTGVIGELYLGGEGLARGYHQRPALTAERFVASPYAQGERLYRTGDLARQRPDGVIEYVGRIDHQVKIRGLRIELGEIEARLLEQDEVHEVAVLAVDTATGLQLVGYVVPRKDIDTTHLRDRLKIRLKEHLPDYMVPVYWLFLDQLPLSPNGKLERKALPKPDASQVQKTYVAPKGALETTIVGIWQTVLKLEKVGVTDNFFELGGDSIISIQVVSRARQAGIHFTPKDLFQHQTIQGLANVAKTHGQGLVIDQGPVIGSAPLLPIQQLFLDTNIPERNHWNRSVLLKPAMALEPQLLEQALNALIQHHDALRLSFTQTDSGWSAEYRPATTSVLWQTYIDGVTQLQSLGDEAQRSLNLQHGPLLRAVLVSLNDGSQRLLLAIHHLVADDVSWGILFDDLQTAYHQLQMGQALALPEKTSAYKTWGEKLQDYGRSDALQQELAYWVQQLDASSHDLPQANPEGCQRHGQATTVDIKLSKTLTQQLMQVAPAAYRTQIIDLLLTALTRTVSQWTSCENVLVQLESHGREALFDDIDLTRTVGRFTSLYPVKLTAHKDWGEAIKQVKEQLRAIPDKGIGFGVLRYLGDTQVQASLDALPMPRIAFNYRDQTDSAAGALFVPVREKYGVEKNSNPALCNRLTIHSQIDDGQLSMAWIFSQEVIPAEVIQKLSNNYLQALEQLVAYCCDTNHQGATPSDFPLAGLSQAQLDTLSLPIQQIEDLYPLSPMQQGMMFHTLEASEAAAYINQTAVPVSGLDIARFTDAWNTAVERHEILRTGFWTASHLAEPLQMVFKKTDLPLRILDWQNRESCANDLQDLIEADNREGFDLLAAPLMRLTLIKLPAEQLYLIWTHHHILLDGWSSSRLLAEVFEVYNGKTPEPKRGKYRDYIAWLKTQSQSSLETFWKQKLQGLNGPTVLANSLSPRPDPGCDGHEALYLNWDAQQTQHLIDQAQRLRVTPNTFIQATWLLLLQRYTGQDSVCFGSTVAGRPLSLEASDEMLGLFINTLPIIQTPQPQQTVTDWLRKLQTYNLEVRDHEHASLADVQRWSGQGGQALFDSIIVFENYPVDERLQEAEQDHLKFGETRTQGVTNFAMDLAVNLGDRLTVEFMYLRNCFTAEATAQLRRSFETLLLAMLENPKATLGSLSTLNAGEQRALQQDNELVAEVYDLPLLVTQIRNHAVTNADAVAVICDQEQLTYGQLEQRANRLAHYLIAQGVGPEIFVGVALERSVDVVVAFYAVMKTGGAYVPLDIDYPQDRVKWIVEDSAMAVLLTQGSLRERFSQPWAPALIELDTLPLTALSDRHPQSLMDADNLAYLIYTSGSTGKPKGVAVSHGQIRMHCQAIGQRYEMDNSTRELLFMSFAFDGAQERWLSTLAHGGQLVVRENRLWTPEETWHALHAHRISIACFPPAYLQQLAEYARDCGKAPPAVRIYCFGGDAVAEANFELVKHTLKPVYLTNGYGPTETVVTPLLWKVPVSETCGAVYAPIGTRVGERTLYVLDEHLNPLPEGVAGELYIGGEGVARGYHQRPGLTAERFVLDPFAANGSRLYRTGDLVRQRPNGVIDYLGRLDNQVKIRGFRIELGEIESRLRDIPGVQDAVVVAREAGVSKQLIGYVVTPTDDAPGERLRALLQADLPDYMVPTQIIRLAALPLNPNGKIDRKALPDPDFKGREFVAPRNAVEQALAIIWQQVLELESVGVTDNFFELGGDSLRILKVLSKVRNQPELGLELKLRDMIGKPTIAELSGFAPATDLDPLLLLNSRVPHVPPLFCLHAGFGTVFDYDTLARRLEGQRSVYGLQCRMLLDRDWQDESLASMAIDYAQYIRQKQAQGPYQLVGWSLGGTLAVLVAQELEKQGQEVEFLGLVDSFIPSTVPAARDLDWGDDLRGFLAVIFAQACEHLPVVELPADSPQAMLERSITDIRQQVAGTSAFSNISVEELAHTFMVAMKLKGLSLDLKTLPQTRASACCWWACDANSPDFTNPVAGSILDERIVAGHYQMLNNSQLLHSLLQQLPQREAVTR